MTRSQDHSTFSGRKPPCNHPLALVIDATENEISELEQMLANCPNCSRWSPGDGPIMAVVTSRDVGRAEETKELS